MKVSKAGAETRVGVWIIGAFGDISTTLIVGTQAIQHNLASETGLITAIGPFSQLDLIPYTNIIFGGCDVRQSSTLQAATDVYHRSKTFSREMLDEVTPFLEDINDNIWVDQNINWSPLGGFEGYPPLADIIQSIRDRIKNFKERNNIDLVIVANLASAEPTPISYSGTETLAGIENIRMIQKGQIIGSNDNLSAFENFKMLMAS